MGRPRSSSVGWTGRWPRGLTIGRWHLRHRRIRRRTEIGPISSFRAYRPPRALCVCVVVVLALILAAPHVAFASGEERTTAGDGLFIRTDTRWAGGTLGGYLPVRIEITNQAPRGAGVRSRRPPTERKGQRSSGSLA